MAGGLYGADVVQLRFLGNRLDQAAEEIDRAGHVLTQGITATTQWQGPDAALFRNIWSSSHHPRVSGAAAALRAAARTVRLNADQQEQASRADGESAGDVGRQVPPARTWAVPGQCSVKGAEALAIVRKALDTGGWGVTRSDRDKILGAFDGLAPEERAEVIAGLTDKEIAVLRDQMQESGIKGGWSHSQQAAFYRELATEPGTLKRLLGDDWPTKSDQVSIPASSEPAAFLRTVVDADSGEGQISIFRTDDGKYVVNLHGIEDEPHEAILRRNTAPGSDSPIVSRWATQSIGDDKNWAETWENPYAVQVRLALQEAGVPPGADVMLVGHSFGAYTTMELATDTTFNGDYVNVKTVVAMAADVDVRLDDMPAGTTGLILNNANDLLANVESLQRQNETSMPSGWREVTFDGARDDIGHSVGKYSAFLDASGAGVVPAEVSEFMGAGTRTDYAVHDIYR